MAVYNEKDNSMLRQLQMYELNLLKTFAGICEKHHLKYYMIGGTTVSYTHLDVYKRQVLNDSDTITFTVTAQRSVIERMDAEDFVAVANMQDIVNMSQIPITITAQKYANQLTINQRTQYVELNVENVVSKTFDIKMDEEGTPPKGYSLSESLSLIHIWM